MNGDIMNEGPKLSIPGTNKTLKVKSEGDRSPSCKIISDFMIFYQSHHNHKENGVIHVTAIVNTKRYSSNYSTV